MVGSKGKGKAQGKASVSKSNANNLALACAVPESLKCSNEEFSDDPLDGKEENNQILNKGSNSTGEEMRDLVIGKGFGKDQHANQTNVEVKEPGNEINFDEAEDVPLCLRTVVSEKVTVGSGAASNVDVGENEEWMNEVALEEDKERIQDGVGNNIIEGGKEQNSSEAAVRENMNIDEGLCASEHGIVEERLTDNMQDEEANTVNAEAPVDTPANNEKTECADQDANIASDVKSVPAKVDRPKKKVLKKKVVKKKILVRNEATSQSLVGNEPSDKADKADTNEAVKIGEIGEERRGLEVDVEGNMNIDEDLCASEHGIMEEKLMDNLRNEEANKVNVEEPMSSPTDDGKIETREDASICNEAASFPGKIVRPKRKVLKKKVVTKEMVVQDDVGSMEENTSGALTVGEPSDEMDKEDTNKDEKDEENAVSADHGKIKFTCVDSSTAGNVKEDPGKANGPKRKVLKKKVVKKVVLGNAVAPANEAKLEGSINQDASGEANKADTNKDAKNDKKVEIKPALRVKRTRVRKKISKGPINVATASEAKPEVSISRDASGEANKADTDKDVKNDEKAEIKPADKAKRKIVKKEQKSQTNVATADGEQKSKVTNDGAGNKKDEVSVTQDPKNEEAMVSGVAVNRLKKRKMKKMIKEDTQKVAADDVNKPGPSRKIKKSGKTDSMGMIFMCSSETKKDCYHYKVLGLPAGKKDTVLKIYKGMRLFLFDIDQRMMYGIYKAAGHGGYNIEPRAFKRKFPAQVRFTVLRDCLPLAEEKFRTAIKDNYYTNSKFSCQLTHEQVKNLCKLFTIKRTEPKPPARNPRTQIPSAPSSSSLPDRKRKRAEDTRKSDHSDRRRSGRAEDARKPGHSDRRRSERAEDTRKSGQNDRQRSGRTESRISSAELRRNRRRRVHEEGRRAREDVRRPTLVNDHEEIRRAREDVRRPAPVDAHEEVRWAREDVRCPAPVDVHEEVRWTREDERRPAPVDVHEEVRWAREDERRLAPIDAHEEVRWAREEIRRPAPVDAHGVGWDREDVRRPAPIVIDDSYHRHHGPVHNYGRESYHPPAPPTTVYQHLPSQFSYDYERASSRVEDIYRSGNSSGLEHRPVDLPRISRELERPVANVDTPYVPYRETHTFPDHPPYETTQARREAEYESTTNLSVRPTEYFTVSDRYRAPLPPYRRY